MTSTHNSTQRRIIPNKTTLDFNLLLFLPHLHFILFTTNNKRKFDLLLIDNNSKKKKIAKESQTSSNSSKTTGNITLAHFI